jgi:hypothetical protein
MTDISQPSEVLLLLLSDDLPWSGPAFAAKPREVAGGGT